MGVLAERLGQLGGPQRWTNYIMAGGRLVGIHVENADETTLTRYFHTDHLSSIAVITNETGQVAQRLSYDAWGLRRHPDGTPDPAGAIQSESTRGFTGHEHLAEVGLIHMNGRVYDPLLARFGTPDPMTEDPYSTQGWNRYSYVGNSPVNFTDPSGYCFMGCFWKPLFASVGRFFSQNWRAILQIAVTATCQAFTGGGPACAALGSFVAGVTSGNLGMALRSAAIAFVTAAAMHGVGELTGHTPDFMSPAHAANIAGHALVGCASAVAQGGQCGPGALSGAAGSFASPILRGADFTSGLVAHAVVGGLASVAGGGNFANGAVTTSFGYLFNAAALLTVKGSILKPWHSAVWIWNDGEPHLLDQNGSYQGDVGDEPSGGYWTGKSADIERLKKYWNDRGETVDVTWLNTSKADDKRMVDWLEKEEGGGLLACTVKASQCLRQVPSMKDLPDTIWPSKLYDALQKYKMSAPPQFSPKP